MSAWAEIAAGLAPSVGIGVLFVIVIRAIVMADRRERAARAKIESEINRDDDG